MTQISNLALIAKLHRGVDTRHRRLGLSFSIRCEMGALLAAGPAENAASRGLCISRKMKSERRGIVFSQ